MKFTQINPSSLWDGNSLIELIMVEFPGFQVSARCTGGYSLKWDWGGPILDLLSDHRFVAIGPSTFTVKRVPNPTNVILKILARERNIQKMARPVNQIVFNHYTNYITP